MSNTREELEIERRILLQEQRQQERDIDGVTDEMITEVMELLQVFGVPYIVSPMEAEAQCAELEKLGLVEGIITDDSDVFLFGGQRVYKNIFQDQKFVEAFAAQDIQKELGFNRESLISLALLLGSDYTLGVNGVGIVNATEIVHTFPGIEGLKDFRKWVDIFDFEEVEKKTQNASSHDPTAEFKLKHRGLRHKWDIADDFPSLQVVNAYEHPEVNSLNTKFSWSLPDLNNLRIFCKNAFGWDEAKANVTLIPLMKECTSGPIQTRIDSFFSSYEDNVKYAKIQSKRLLNAVKKATKTPELQSSPHKINKKRKRIRSEISLNKGQKIKISKLTQDQSKQLLDTSLEAVRRKNIKRKAAPSFPISFVDNIKSDEEQFQDNDSNVSDIMEEE